MFLLKRDECSKAGNLLSAYVDQELQPRNRQMVEQHLIVCGPCRKKLDALRVTVGLLHRVPQAMPRRSFSIPESMAVLRPASIPSLQTGTAMIAIFLALLFIGDLFHLFVPQPVPQALQTPSSQSQVQGSAVAAPSSPSLSAVQPHPDSGNQGLINSLNNLRKGTAALWWLRPFELGLLMVMLLLGTGGLVSWRRTRKETVDILDRYKRFP